MNRNLHNQVNDAFVIVLAYNQYNIIIYFYYNYNVYICLLMCEIDVAILFHFKETTFLHNLIN